MPTSREKERTAPEVDRVRELDREFEAACEALADLIVEAIELSLNRSGGTETHAPECRDADLIAALPRGTTEG